RCQRNAGGCLEAGAVQTGDREAPRLDIAGGIRLNQAGADGKHRAGPRPGQELRRRASCLGLPSSATRGLAVVVVLCCDPTPNINPVSISTGSPLRTYGLNSHCSRASVMILAWSGKALITWMCFTLP